MIKPTKSGNAKVGGMAGVPGTGAKRPTAARKNTTNSDKNKMAGMSEK